MLEFAEGMSKELLGIEQIRGTQEITGQDNENSEYQITPDTIEHDTQEIGLGEINRVVQDIRNEVMDKKQEKDDMLK